MLRMLKRFCWLLILGLAVQPALSFSLIGPVANGGDNWQVPVIGYSPNPVIDPRPLGPKNIGEEFRRNKPVAYYSMDQNFLDFFGSNGAVAIDQAFAIMNKVALTNVSKYSANLAEFPLEAQRINFQAQALALTDVKSVTLKMLMEQMGLTTPERYVWQLHAREHLPNTPACPAGMAYYVIKRNFDPMPSASDQIQYSSYINGTLYSYRILERCTAAGLDPRLADAEEFPVDPLANTFTAVASAGLYNGGFYTGLTRDDMGGIRYLLRTNNMNIEDAGADPVTFATNNNVFPIPSLDTSDLSLLIQRAQTNDTATLIGLYPGLVILNSSSYFANVLVTNTTITFTNYPWDPVGTPPHATVITTYSTNFVVYFQHQFGNVITNHPPTNGFITIITTNGATTLAVAQTGGDFYFEPQGLCGVSILSTQLVGTVFTTNTVLAANGTVDIVSSFQQYRIYYYPVACLPNATALRQGVEKVRFVRRDYDSLFNQFFEPVTNEYTLNTISNSTLIPQFVRRTATGPDILFTATDMAGGPATLNAFFTTASLVPFDLGHVLPGLAGPGTIGAAGSQTITFNKVGPAYYNYSPANMDEAGQSIVLIWGSFDGTTNAPVVYPSGFNLENLENQIFLQVTPAGPALPDGQLGVNYTNAFSSGFTATGGTPPYTWSLAPGSPGLPLNLTLNSTSGILSGAPQTTGTYDFVVRMTEFGGRSVDRPYSITITP
jgi:hypothetical protein